MSIQAIAHYRHLQAIRDRGGLDPKGTNASISNRQWFTEWGVPNKQREELHNRILRQTLGPQLSVGQVDPPIAILLAGPPGSGKSSARRALFDASDERITGGLNSSDFVTIDADSIKEQLLDAAERDGSLQSFLMPPEAKELQSKGEVFSKLDFASLVHEESSNLAKRCQRLAINERRNLILDQVCSNSEKTAALIDTLADQGYRIRVVEIHAEKEFSEQSVFLRYLRDQERVDGRYVPTEVIDSVYAPDGTSRPRQSIQGILDANPCQVEAYRRFDATTVGQPPVLTQRGHLVDGRLQYETTTHGSQPVAEAETLPSKRTLLASFPNPLGATRPTRSTSAKASPLTPGHRSSRYIPIAPKPEKQWGR